MLEKLVIRNFQKHKKLSINLSERISVIRGPTDRGKSSILRAIRWAMLNKPNGTEMIRKGAKSCRVRIVFDEGSVLIRLRGTSRNEYVVNGKVLKAFGSSVPKEVAKLANVSEDNFQGQHDSPFWLGLAAGQVSKNLNEIVDLSAIDSSLQYLNQQLRIAKTEAEVSKSRLTEAKVERDRTKIALRMRDDLSEITQKRKQAKAAREKAGHLETIVGHTLESLRISRTIRISSKKLERILSDVGAIVERIERIEGERNHLAALITDLRKRSAENESIREELESVSKSLAEYEVCPTCQRPMRKRS